MKSLILKIISKFNLENFIKIYSFIAAPIFFPIAFVLFLLKIRIINIVWVNAIGHICLETETFLREKILNKKINYKCILLLPKNKIANLHIAKYLKLNFYVFTNNFLCGFLTPLKNCGFLNHDISKYMMDIWSAAKHYNIISRTREIKNLYTLNSEDTNYGFNKLKKYNFSENDWFVTIHARDPNFRNNGEPNVRDSDIQTYIKAIKYVISIGGYVIRMGHSKNLPVNFIHEKFIDYALSDIKSERMDVFLCAKSKIYIGTNSGLINIPLMFGTPIVSLNVMPLCQLNTQPGSINVPKLLIDKSSGKLIKFEKILSKTLGNSFYTKTFIDENVKIINNSEELIYDVVKEALNRVNGDFIETNEDKYLQKRFHQMFRPEHYCYETPGLISAVFLRKYKDLL